MRSSGHSDKWSRPFLFMLLTILVISCYQTYPDLWQTMLPIIYRQSDIVVNGWTGADVEAGDKDGHTSLYRAACGGHLEVVQSLVSAGDPTWMVTYQSLCTAVYTPFPMFLLCECLFPKQSATLKSDSSFNWLVYHKLLLWTGKQHIMTALTSGTLCVVRHFGDFIHSNVPRFITYTVTHHISSKWLRGEWLDRCRCFRGQQRWSYITVPCSLGRTSRSCAIPFVSRWSYMNGDLSVIVHWLIHAVSNVSLVCECLFRKQPVTLKSESMFDSDSSATMLLTWSDTKHITRAPNLLLFMWLVILVISFTQTYPD